MCGSLTLAWTSFQTFLLTLGQSTASSRKHLPDYHHTRASPAMQMVRQVAAPIRDRTFLKMLDTTHQLSCEHSRDRVFALLGLAAGGDLIRADYKMPLPVLLNAALRQAYQYEPPKNTNQIDMDCLRLETMFDLSAGSMYELVEHSGLPPPRSVGKSKLTVPGSKISYWCALHYQHNAVQELLFDVGAISEAKLQEAVSNNDPHTLKLLLASGRFDVNHTYGNVQQTMLHDGAWRGHTHTANVLLACPNINVNIMNDHGETPLMCALLHRFTITLNEVEYGVRARGVAGEEHNAGLESISVEGLAMLRLLLSTGKAHISNDGSRNAPLGLAVRQRDVQVVKLLLDAGAEDNRNIRSNTFPNEEHDSHLFTAVCQEDVEVVEMMLDTGRFNANVKSSADRSCLAEAAKNNDASMLELLLRKGSLGPGAGYKSHTDDLGQKQTRSIFHDAVELGHEAIARIFLTDGRFDIDALANGRRSALQLAILKNNVDMVGLLLEHGASVAGAAETMSSFPGTVLVRERQEIASLLSEHWVCAMNAELKQKLSIDVAD